MKKIDVNEIYTLFEEIRELVKAGSRNNRPIQPEIKLPDLSVIDELSAKLDEAIGEIRKPVRTEHHHIFSIASSKVFYGIIGLCAYSGDADPLSGMLTPCVLPEGTPKVILF